MRIIILMSMLISFTFAKAGKKDTLRLWAFNNELIKGGAIARFQSRNTGVTVSVKIVPHNDNMYYTELKRVLDLNDSVPDLFLGEADVVKKLVESGHWDNLRDAPYSADVKELVPYQVEMGKDSMGILRALPRQTTPGGFFYRRSLARKHLGTDDPVKIGEMLNSPEKFLETARMLVKESDGEVKIIAGIPDYQEFSFSSRKEGFINAKGELFIDSALIKFLNIADTLRMENLTAELNRLSSKRWYSRMGKDGEVFGYILPTWGLPLLKENAPDAKGDYGLTNGPNPYFWGGTWIGIYKNSKNKELAWKFVKMMTLDTETLKWWAKSTGDFVGNQAVINEIKETFSDPYLKGQNHYKFFANEATKINAKIICLHEKEIRDTFMVILEDYIEGKCKTKTEAINLFKQKVKETFPDIITQYSKK